MELLMHSFINQVKHKKMHISILNKVNILHTNIQIHSTTWDQSLIR